MIRGRMLRFAHNFVARRSFARDFHGKERLTHHAADRRRMLQDSQSWKSMLSNWRLVVVAMPDRPELEASFAFMQDYMSVNRSTPPPQAPTAQ